MISLHQMTAALKTLYSTYPNVKLDDRAIEEWLCIFEKYPLDHFEQAFRAAKFVSGEFIPTPGLVMKELRSISESASGASQTKNWCTYGNGNLCLEITTTTVDDKGKTHTDKRRYADMTNDQTWESRKAHFAAGRLLCIESIESGRISYSFQKWPLPYTSVLLAEGGVHEHNGEKLPYLVRI